MYPGKFEQFQASLPNKENKHHMGERSQKALGISYVIQVKLSQNTKGVT